MAAERDDEDARTSQRGSSEEGGIAAGHSDLSLGEDEIID